MSIITFLVLCATAFGAERDRGLLVQVGASEWTDDVDAYATRPAFEIGYRSRRWTPGARTATSFEVAYGLDFVEMLWVATPAGHLAWGFGTSPDAPVDAEVTLGALILVLVPLPEVGLRLAIPTSRTESGVRSEVGVFARYEALPASGFDKPWMRRWVAGGEATFVLGHTSR